MTSTDRQSFRTTAFTSILAGFLMITLSGLASAEPPAGEQPAASQPAATQPAGAAAAGTKEKDAKVDALSDLIREKLAKKLEERPPQDRPGAANGAGKPLPVDARRVRPRKDFGKGKGGIDLTPPPPDAPQPKWICKQAQIEHPPLWRGAPARFTFEITNGGAGPLNLRMKGCGCGMKISGPMARSIAPGETEKIETIIPTEGRSGEFTRTIPMETNDAAAPYATLTCRGRVLVPMHISPVYVNFGKLDRDGERQTQTLTITRGDGGPIAPEVVQDEQAPYETKLREIVPGEKYELDVTVQAPLPVNSLYGALKLKTGVKEMPEDAITVMARTMPRLRAMPPNILVRPEETSAETHHEIVLVWSGDAPGQVTGVEVTDPRLEAMIEEDEEGRQVVALAVPHGYAPEGVQYLTILTDDSQTPRLRVPVVTVNARQANTNQVSSQAEPSR